jgi:GAF domain-containing protein
MATEARWPSFTPVAVSQGVAASLSLPIPVAETVAAALNVYATRARAFHDVDRQSLRGLVGFAAAAIANMHLYDESRTLVEQMRAAAQSRAVIDQARGILMVQNHCGPEEAFAILRQTSQHANRKIRDLARDIVDRASGADTPAP